MGKRYEEIERAESGWYVRWDKPLEIEGVLENIWEAPSKYDPEKAKLKFRIRNDDGSAVEGFAPAALVSLLRSPKVQIGRRYKIVYDGTYVMSSTGKPSKNIKMYEVKE